MESERARLTVGSPIGPLVLVATERALTGVLFAREWRPDEWAPDTPSLVDACDHRVLVSAARQLAEYFAAERTEFDLRLSIEGSPFELDVWNALRSIPYGETISYARQAEIAGHPGAFQAVGAANGRNPIPIILPCHRVIGSDGSLVGFGGGLATKRWLLDLEAGVQHLPF